MDREECRDYQVEAYQNEDDPRFKMAFHEGIFTQVLCLSAIFIELIAAYGLCPENPDEMTYILGFPTWFFISALVAVTALVIVMIYIAKFAKDISFDAREQEGEKNE